MPVAAESLEAVVHSGHHTKPIPVGQRSLDLPTTAALQLPSELIVCKHEFVCMSVCACESMCMCTELYSRVYVTVWAHRNIHTYIHICKAWWHCFIPDIPCTGVFVHPTQYCTSLSGRVQGQVTGVMDVMRGNIDKMMQRGERLDNLEEKSGTVLCMCCNGNSTMQHDHLLPI